MRMLIILALRYDALFKNISGPKCMQRDASSSFFVKANNLSPTLNLAIFVPIIYVTKRYMLHRHFIVYILAIYFTSTVSSLLILIYSSCSEDFFPATLGL